MVKLNKNRSENFLAFVSTRARSGSRPNSECMNDVLDHFLHIYIT